MTTTTQPFTDADIIYTYTRAQAIQDGYQMKLEDKMAVMASNLYKYPIYLTSGIVGLIEQAVASERHRNDWNDVLWDILWMSRYAGRDIDDQTKQFTVIITGTSRRRNHTMIIQCGPTDIDDPMPAFTIMLPEES